jgi:DNA-binding PadR family transcriptional regulator
MSRSLSHFWPRAESKLYEEPKKLVAQGLVRASTRTVGKRSSTVYSITAAGRRELKRWMARPGAGPALEFELLLQVFFSENGTRTDLLATIDAAAAWAAERSNQNVEVAREYLAGRGAFPDRVPQVALVAAFLTGYWDAITEWAAQAREVVEEWPETPSEAEPPWHIIEAIATR